MTQMEMFPQPVWHWMDPNWNDRAVEFQVVTAVNEGRIKPRKWSWPVLKPYNGNSGEDRVLGWQKTWAAVHMGLIPQARVCSVCGSRHSVQYHNEDYLRPLNAKPICKSCHFALHKRFEKDRQWNSIVKQCRYDGCWFENLNMAGERSEEAMLRQRAVLRQWPIDTPAPLLMGLSACPEENPQTETETPPPETPPAEPVEELQPVATANADPASMYAEDV